MVVPLSKCKLHCYRYEILNSLIERKFRPPWNNENEIPWNWE